MQSAMADSTSKICLKWHWRAFKMTVYGYTLRGHEQGNGVTMKRDGYWWHNEPGMAGEWYVISHFYISRCSRLVTIILCATVEMCSGLLVFLLIIILIPPAPIYYWTIPLSPTVLFVCIWLQITLSMKAIFINYYSCA